MKPGDLTPADVGTLEVRVKQEVETECELFTGVVNPNIKVKFFLPKNESVGQTELVVPHGPREVAVHE